MQGALPSEEPSTAVVADLPLRMAEEIRTVHDMVLSLETEVPDDVHMQLRRRSEALLDLASQFSAVRTTSFGEHLIDERDVFMKTFFCLFVIFGLHKPLSPCSDAR